MIKIECKINVIELI